MFNFGQSSTQKYYEIRYSIIELIYTNRKNYFLQI